MTTTASLSPKVAQPAHVPDDLVYDFDLFADPGLVKDGYDRILEIAQKAPPVFWSPRNGGQWVIRSYAGVYQAQRDPETFSNAPMPAEQIQAINAALPDDQKMLIPSPITFDPPQHTVFRKPIQGVFSPKAMAALKDDVRKLAAELIDEMKPAGHCEFMAAVAEPLPVRVFLKLFGLPLERADEYRALVIDHLASNGDPDPTATQRRLRNVADVLRDVIIDRRDNPCNDILSLLWQSDFDGRPATLFDIESYAVMLFIAGLDTVYNGMGLGILHLARDAALQAELRADRGLIAGAAEELLRRYSFTVPPRFLTKDTEFQGVAMKKGEKALIFLPAADLDKNEFPNPEKLDLQRENKVHIAFGTGPHRCLGSHLARIEMQILYEEMLDRLPPFRLSPDAAVSYHGGHVLGPGEIHLVWDI